MGYTGEKALKFKEGYIKQFSEMEKALTDKNRERIKALTCRMALTEALQQSTENLHGFAYSLYTDLVYKAVFGKNARQLRETLKLDKKRVYVSISVKKSFGRFNPRSSLFLV